MENVQGGGPESPLDFENSNEWPESLCLKGRDTNLWLCFFFFLSHYQMINQTFWGLGFFLFFLNLPDQEDLDIFRKPPKKQDTPRSLFEQMASVEHNDFLHISFKSILKSKTAPFILA